MIITRRTTLAALLSLILAACGGGGGNETVAPPPAPATKAEVNTVFMASMGPAYTTGAWQQTLLGNMVSIDINEDTRPDMVLFPTNATVGSKMTPLVLTQQADGSLRDDTLLYSMPDYEVARMVSVADFDGDGHRDIFIADPGLEDPAKFSYQYGGFPGGFSQIIFSNGRNQHVTSVKASAAAFNHSADAADIDGSGRPSVFVSSLNSVANYLVTPNGRSPLFFQREGLPAEMRDYSWTPSCGGTCKFTAPGTGKFVDVNGDGRPDLVVSSYTPYSKEGVTAPAGTRIYLNLGGGQFSDSYYASVPQPNVRAVIGAANNITSADFDGNGLPDLVIQFETSDGALRGVFQVVMQTAPGIFEDRTVEWLGGYGVSKNLPVGGVQVVDIDSDGRPDLFFKLHQIDGVARTVSQAVKFGVAINRDGAFYGLKDVPANVGPQLNSVYRIEIAGSRGDEMQLLGYGITGNSVTNQYLPFTATFKLNGAELATNKFLN